MRGYLPLIQKDSSNRMLRLTVYVKGLPFTRDLSLENSADSYLCFRLALLYSVSYFFFLCWSSSSSLCMVFDSILSNINEVLSINWSANVFIPFWWNWSTWWTLTIVLSQTTLLRWLTFLPGSQTVILLIMLFWIYFFVLTLVFVLQWLFPIGKFWSCCCLKFHWLSITMGCFVSSDSLWLFSCWLGWSSWSFERCSMGGYL